MKHAYSEKVVIRKDAVVDGQAQLSLRIIINMKKKEFNLWVKTPIEAFDEAKQRAVIPGDAEKTNTVNAVIHRAKSKAQQVFTDAILSERPLTIATFAEHFANTAARNCFLSFFEKEIKKAEDERASKTVASYRATWRKLKQFRDEIPFSMISTEFLEDFNRWLIKKHKLEPNTLGRHHKNLKKFIGIAIRRGMRFPNPYMEFKIPSARTERDWLQLPEVQSLIDIYKVSALPAELHRILRHWLFMMSTSLRWSDFEALREVNVESEHLNFRPIKTRNSMMRIQVPLCDFAKKLIEDARRTERGKAGRIFETTTGQNENRYLKEIAHLAGIKKNLTTVVARHTFATTFLILNGKIEVLQRIMGHSKIETTMVYVHILGEQKTAQVKNFDIAFKF
jgi:integrase/recombinase XerD